MDWKRTEVLIIGGSGSLGTAIAKKMLQNYHPRGIRIYSRGEYLQEVMRRNVASWGLHGDVAYLIGDVKDYRRLQRACVGVDLIINAAAMKQVPACEDNPIEATQTNIIGAENIIDCAIDNGVSRVMHISTDKAVYPVNLYGATKMVAEKMFTHANVYSGGEGTIFSCCRYGNVLGSRGSIIPLFREQAKAGTLTVTDETMTRFWITLDDVADFILSNIETMRGGEIFIPKMPSMNIMDLANVIGPGCEKKITGIRNGEKLHEVLITYEESSFAIEQDDRFVINHRLPKIDGKQWKYDSNHNSQWLNKSQLSDILQRAGL
jgi:FlaA1/EpsC-like NDP-sugar epimerase